MPFAIRHKLRIVPALIVCLLGVSCVADRDERGTVTVVFKHGKLAGDEKVFRDLLREFERVHVGLTIKEELLPSSTDQQHQFYAMNLESRNVPFDLFAIDVIWAQEFARAGWIRSLDEHVPRGERAAFFPAAIEAAIYDDALYAVPWYLDAGILFYRKDLLARYGITPPRTWPDLIESTNRILDGERDSRLKGFIWTGKQYEGLVCVALEFIWGRGGTLFVEGDTVGLAEAEEALGLMRNLIVTGISPPVVATTDEETARHLFGTGRAVYMRNWPYAWSLLQDQDSAVKARIGVARLPAFPGHESTAALGGWLLAIPKAARHGDAAAELLRFLVSPQAQRYMAMHLGYKPAYRHLYRDPDLTRAQPLLTELLPIYESARPRHVSPYYLMLSQLVQPELSAVVVGRKSPRKALHSAQQQIDATLGLERTVSTTPSPAGDARAPTESTPTLTFVRDSHVARQLHPERLSGID